MYRSLNSTLHKCHGRCSTCSGNRNCSEKFIAFLFGKPFFYSFDRGLRNFLKDNQQKLLLRDYMEDIKSIDLNAQSRVEFLLPFSAGCSAFAALQLQSFCTCRTVHAGHTVCACVQTLCTYASLHVVAIVTAINAFAVLQQ